jgi:arylsulfatase A-like enzyme
MIGLAVGLVFLALSFIRIAGDANSAMFGGRVLDATLEQSLWGTKLGLNLGLFGASLLLVHLAFGALVWILACFSPAAWPRSRNGVRAWTLLWGALLILWILAANARWFPSSSLGFPYASIVTHPVLGLSVFAIVSLVVWGAVSATLVRHIANRGALFRPAVIALGGSACVALGVALIAGPVRDARAVSDSDTRRPNIILIGLDSFRPDHVGARAGTSLTPEIDRFLAGATEFSDAITPLARTFPSWVSILSGKHPHTTGAVINLFPRERIREGATLPELLREHGYQTIYGIDEVRFSNVDESYGFDRMISPPIGSTDFLVGQFADTPLSNLLVNTIVGRFLFPQVHGNRAMAVTYDPDTFIQMLEREIRPAGPSFIAVHFTLAHWPYTWASGPAYARATGPIEDLVAAYPAAVSRVDRQFGDLMTLLESRGALENAIVVVLSDHGESLGEELPFPGEQSEDSMVYGHGTNVLAGDQYNVLLAVRSYGETALGLGDHRLVTAPVSLEDIAPTVVEVLKIDSAERFDGQSLLPLLVATQDGVTARERFIETEFNPAGFALGELMRASEFASAAKSYRIDPVTDRVLVREENIAEILASRQYAVLRDGNLLASLPIGEGELQSLLFVPAGAPPVWLPAPPDPAENSLVSELWGLLAQRFEPVSRRPVAAWPW